VLTAGNQNLTGWQLVNTRAWLHVRGSHCSG